MQACSNRETWPTTKTGLPSASFGNNSLNFLNPPTLALTLQPINPHYGLGHVPAQLSSAGSSDTWRLLPSPAATCGGRKVHQADLHHTKDAHFVSHGEPAGTAKRTMPARVLNLSRPGSLNIVVPPMCQPRFGILWSWIRASPCPRPYPDNATAEASNLTDQNNCNTLSCLNSALIFHFP